MESNAETLVLDCTCASIKLQIGTQCLEYIDNLFSVL